MFLRRHRRTKKDQTYEYWTLVESVRTGRGPRQRTVATIGKLPGLDQEARVGGVGWAAGTAGAGRFACCIGGATCPGILTSSGWPGWGGLNRLLIRRSASTLNRDWSRRAAMSSWALARAIDA